LQPETIVNSAENLGEHLTGETIQNSVYQVRSAGFTLRVAAKHVMLISLQLEMKVNKTCQSLCSVQLTSDDVALLVKRIDEEYNINWIVDNLPAAAIGVLEDDSPLYAKGLPLGGVERDTGNYFMYNHHKIYVKFHEDPSYVGARVVGFDVYPVSVDQSDAVVTACDAEAGMPVQQLAHMIVKNPSGKGEQLPKVQYSYDVFWVPSDIQWASRWDIYLSMGNLYSDYVHWFSIMNSLIISVFLTGMVAMIMVRALRADINRYNRVLTEEEKVEEREETGWKLVHGDVFRPPAKTPNTFAIFAGVGVQLVAMAGTTIVFAAIGFLSPANRGSLMIALVLLFMLMGVVAGYTTARVHKLFNGNSWQRVTLTTAVAFPAFLFTVLFILNMFVWSVKSTNAVKFSSMFAVLCLWLLVSVPLVFLGAYYGFKAEKIELPVRVAVMPRQIPTQPWYLRAPITMLVGGILPFGTVFVELFFILTSLWLDQYYYVFGFLLLVYGLLLVTCAEISIVLTYFQLCAEDYRWWWRSMLVPGASGVYLYLYCMFYYAVNLQISGWVSQMLYFGYMGLVALAFSFITGTVGFLATFWFVRTIYGAIKVS
jgi:transmembrane 9 superfamily protein 2/4